jgi:hypothetical protein
MVGRMRDYLKKGRGVVSNIDLDIRALMGNDKPALMPIRLPDKPGVEDLLALGACHRTCREELNGAIVLDECGTWLNSRGWNDKGRGRLIDWLLHSRKLGWDIFFIIQNASMMDKQIREALMEYHVTCRRMDRLKVPFISGLLKIFSFGYLSGRLPKIHVASVHYGYGPAAFLSETWRYMATDLYDAYSSGQIVDEGGAMKLEISQAPAFPTNANVERPPAMTGEICGMHSLVWYETPRELAKRRAAQALILKPKLPMVERLQTLPPDARIPALKAARSNKVRARLEALEAIDLAASSSRQGLLLGA